MSKNVNEFNLLTSPLDGQNLIESSAGTGKTFAIASIYLRLLVEKKLELDELVVVTYTVAATEELRDRIRNKIKLLSDVLENKIEENVEDELVLSLSRKYANDEDLKLSLKNIVNSFDQAKIFTIHGFCKQLLSDYAFESSSLFDTEFLVNPGEIILEIAEDYWRKIIYNISKDILQFIKKDFSVNKLLKFQKSFPIDSNFKIEPGMSEITISDLEKKYTLLKEKFISFKKEYFENKKAVKKIFFNFKTLNGNIYKEKTVNSLFLELENSWFAQDSLKSIPKKFELLTFEKYSRSIKKGNVGEEHPFLHSAQIFFDSYNFFIAEIEKYKKKLFYDFYEFYQKAYHGKKRELNVRSFDDLLFETAEKLQNQNLITRLRKTYRAALIDEFQDTDVVQYEIFNKIFSHKEGILFLIGDPKQAIYAFRGADIFTYIGIKDFLLKDNSIYTLSKNWRSVPQLVDAVNFIFTLKDNSFLYRQIPFYENSYHKANFPNLKFPDDNLAPMKICMVDKNLKHKTGGYSKDVAEGIIADNLSMEIYSLLNGASFEKIEKNDDLRPIYPHDIAVLVRSKKQAQKIQSSLSKLNIKSVIAGGDSVFYSNEAIEINLFLKAVLDFPSDSGIKAFLLSDMVGYGFKELFELMNDEKEWERHTLNFSRYQKDWEQFGVSKIFFSFVKDYNIKQKLLSLPMGERRITNFFHIIELLINEEKEEGLKMGALLKWLSNRMNEDSSAKLEEYTLRIESDSDAIQIITMHKSKGLEYNIVFCPFLQADSTLKSNDFYIYHREENNKQIPILHQKDKQDESEIKNIYAKENLAENLRLMYVSITRAKFRCYIYLYKKSTADTSAPFYIFHYKSEGKNLDVDELIDCSKKISYTEIENDLKKIEDKNNEIFEIKKISETISSQEKNSSKIISSKKLELSFKKFTREIDVSYSIVSYSWMANQVQGNHNYFQTYSVDLKKDKIYDKLDVNSIPKGAATGNLIHEILEEIDFLIVDEDLKKIIADKSKRYRLQEWNEAIFSLIKNILNTNIVLDKENVEFYLRDIKEKDRLSEMEFNFPIKKIASEKIIDLYVNNFLPYTQGLQLKIESLEFFEISGFLKGFVDLIFIYNGRYYLLDWKTNFLGDDYSDYNSKNIEDAMNSHNYFLQAHIYTVALDLFLEKTVQDYSYEKNFGGILYLFVRGMNPSYKNCGVYFRREEYSFIKKLKNILQGS